jgi:hypothetical protein
MYTAGVANGIPLPDQFGNNSKDVYGRLDYKIGGMGLDGDTGGKPVPDKNWRDNSLRLGVFTYRGDASNIPFVVTTDGGTEANIQDNHFLRTGFYASLFYQDLNVFGAYVHGSDSLSPFDAESAALLNPLTADYHAEFVQADYMIYPWLQAAARYETVTPGDLTVQSLKIGVFNVSALVRANVKAMFEYQRDVRVGENHSLNALLRFAF